MSMIEEEGCQVSVKQQGRVSTEMDNTETIPSRSLSVPTQNSVAEVLPTST